MSELLRAALVTAGILALAAAPAAGATVIHVTLDGEDGGAMTIKADRAEIPAGPVVFEVRNAARGASHEMIVVRLAKAGDTLAVDPLRHRLDEKKLSIAGEASDLAPQATKRLSLTLKPGAYRLVCNIKGHVEAGMVAPLTVVK